MERFYSSSTGNCYLPNLHTDIPSDAVPIDDERYNSVIANPTPGMIRGHDQQGLPILLARPLAAPTLEQLCQHIDAAADTARQQLAGEPLRAVEHAAAASEADAFVQAQYLGAVPPMVAAWAVNGRSPEQAAQDILREAAQFKTALINVRTLRLAGKENVRQLMAEQHVTEAQAQVTHTLEQINALLA